MSSSGATDDYGNEIPDEETVETMCALQQYQRDEASDEAETSTSRSRLFVMADVRLTTADVIEVGGRRFELYGDPDLVDNPRTGGVSHIEATVVRIAGAEDEPN